MYSVTQFPAYCIQNDKNDRIYHMIEVLFATYLGTARGMFNPEAVGVMFCKVFIRNDW